MLTDWKFQSTHPVRGATSTISIEHEGGMISIHAPREGCDRLYPPYCTQPGISIHAPREGCDMGDTPLHHQVGHFNPRTP